MYLLSLCCRLLGDEWGGPAPGADYLAQRLFDRDPDRCYLCRPAVVQITNMQSQVGQFNQGAAVPPASARA